MRTFVCYQTGACFPTIKSYIDILSVRIISTFVSIGHTTDLSYTPTNIAVESDSYPVVYSLSTISVNRPLSCCLVRTCHVIGS